MSIKQLTPNSAIAARLEAQVKRREKAIIDNLNYVGECCVTEARAKGSYPDRTGNLRNSIGYVVGKDGRAVQQGDFSGPGGQEGKRFAHALLSNHSKGIVLLVVAGMNYAAYISAKGYDVLDSAEQLARKLVPNILRTIKIQ